MSNQYPESELLSIITDEQGTEVYDPATEELIGRYRPSTQEDLEAAVSKAQNAQRAFSKLDESERCDLLEKAADAIESVVEPLARLLSREQGKPLNGPNARFEVQACALWLRTTAQLPSPNHTVVDDEVHATVEYQPLGTVGAIGPWNWPMLITIWQVGPALRMGNAVIVKPSEYTPLSVLALVHILNSVLPEDILQILPGDGELGRGLAEHPGINKIMFTGSTSTGRKIVQSSAKNLARLTLELGGNDAGLVLEDVDPKQVAEDLFWGAFINTGQTCAALKRLYVPENLYDSICEELVAVAKKIPMGVGLNEENLLGPLQNKAQFSIVDKLVTAAKNDGARILCGGNPDYDAPGNFYPTTLVADIDPDHPLVTEEQFGPALPIIKYSDLDWAIEQANRFNTGLGSSVWSADVSKARKVAARISAGTTWINSHGDIDPRIPFGGIKSSGYGVEFGIKGLEGVAYPHIIRNYVKKDD